MSQTATGGLQNLKLILPPKFRGGCIFSRALHKSVVYYHIAGYDVRPQACASIFQVYARVPARTTDWPLTVTLRVPDTTAYADEPPDIPEAHLVGQVIFADTEVLTPFLHVSEPIGRSIWIQPAIGCNASMMIAVPPKTPRKRSLSWVLKPLMWASIRVWSTAGSLLVMINPPSDDTVGVEDHQLQ